MINGHINLERILPLLLWTAILGWSDGRVETIATITEDQCMMIPGWINSGFWKPPGREDQIITTFRCENRSSFAPGWDCIQNFNCPK